MASSFMSTLPRDPDEQLRLGLRVIEAAYEEKARHNDNELQQLRAYSKERQSQVMMLERRVAELEQHVRDGEERTRQLSDEKAQLAQDLKTAQRDLSKLDSFKRSIMQSIQGEELPGAAAGSYSVGSEYTPACGGGASLGHPPGRDSVLMGMGPGSPPGAHSLGGGVTPMGSLSTKPAPTTTGGAPLRTTSPLQPSSSTIKMDGKDFFRQARLRLTYEQFNQFLTNIKKLNDHAQSRDETLQKAQDIFGTENEDLFVSFKQLLSKHGLS